MTANLRGTALQPAICSQEVLANPKQPMQTIFWRWGPAWHLGGRSGAWAIRTAFHLAVRVVNDPEQEIIETAEFMVKLLNASLETDLTDDYLRSLDQREEMVSIREAALAGRVGGPDDGAPSKRTRKPRAR